MTGSVFPSAPPMQVLAIVRSTEVDELLKDGGRG
jgi:hypothetical protein